ncbi:hypothetical protein Y032_0032g2489 [Ancylostoma ceylanicum]|uniref:Uncharacterized protein n=1 Tax=Ancylostoma ceylanicum TaxID=53326 RepID=A0A016UQK1_9BILA|nr:hypothetical protein Y032_0032g2489 [Ancylostoma ceylanicum]
MLFTSNITEARSVKNTGTKQSVNGGSTRRDRVAHDVIVAAVANLDFPDSCPSHLMFTRKKATKLSRKPPYFDYVSS